MDLQLRGKSVLVTGGNRGIGREIALGFAREGANVAICARDEAALAAAREELLACGVKALSMKADLFGAEDCERVVAETVEAFGGLDILINNASTNVRGSVMTAGDDLLMQRINGKMLGSLRCARAAVPHMKRASGGRIICIGGTSIRDPGNLPAGLGNSALANLVKHLSDEVARDGITVNVIHPSFCKSDRYPERLAARAKQLNVSLAEAEASFAEEFPIGRIVEPSDVAPMILFLASPHASAITGQGLAIDGGICRGVVY